MHPILYRIGPFLLYSFTAVIGLGLLAGVGLAYWQARPKPQPGWFDGLLLALAAGLAGGRLGYVWAQWDYFQERVPAVWRLWQGGYSYHGALLAALTALWFWWWWRGRPRQTFAAYAGALATGIALATAFGWLACWMDGCAYGRETTIGPWAADLPDEFGVYAMRYQTQLMGLGLSLLVFALVMALRGRLAGGRLFWFTLFALSAGRALVSLWRGDIIPSIGRLRADTWLDTLLALAFLGLFLIETSRARGESQS